MRKIVLVLVVLVLAAPVMAAVSVTLTQWLGGPGLDDEATISWDARGEPNLVRAFALDFKFDASPCNDANDVGSVTVTYTNPDYDIYPGSIDINDTTGVVDDWGSPVCDASYYPGTLSLADSNGITIEMASLYKGAPNAPDPCGVLLKFTLNKTACVDINENVIRGGVVMENGSGPVGALTLTGGTVLVCLGDMSSKTGPKDGKVNVKDYLLLVAQWKRDPLTDVRVDISSKTGAPDGNCNIKDYMMLVSHWKKDRSCVCP